MKTREDELLLTLEYIQHKLDTEWKDADEDYIRMALGSTVHNTFVKIGLIPSKHEILEEMKLHNEDEVGIDDQWTYEDTEYHLLLSDKYHKRSQSSVPPPHVYEDMPIHLCKVHRFEKVGANQHGQCCHCQSSLDEQGACTGDEYSVWLNMNR